MPENQSLQGFNPMPGGQTPLPPSPPMLKIKDATFFHNCWVNPDHPGREVSGMWKICDKCHVEWRVGPYWKMDGKWFPSRTAYNYWVAKHTLNRPSDVRDITCL